MAKKYSIVDYGAVSEGGLCTKEIQKAIDDCFLNGGGEVVVPTGRYLTGCIRLRSNVTLHLMEDAVLLGSLNPDDYMDFIHDTVEPIPQEEWEMISPTVNPEAELTIEAVPAAFPYSRRNNAIIRAIKAENIAIIGERGSQIDGQNCYDPLNEEGYRGPHAMNFWFCKNVEFAGYTVKDSGNWAHAIQNTQNIHAHDLTVLAGHDGFDVRTCDNILVENCVFRSGDDAIAGFDNIDMIVRNCVFDCACSMLRIGGNNILVEKCLGFSPSTYGFRGHLTQEEKQNRMPTTQACRHQTHRVFLYYCDNRAKVRKTPGNICIRDCYFKNLQEVMSVPWGHKWCCNRPLADVRFENCIFDGVFKASDVVGAEEEPLSIAFKNCSVIATEGGRTLPFIVGKHIKQVQLENVRFEGFENPVILCDPPAEVIEK